MSARCLALAFALVLSARASNAQRDSVNGRVPDSARVAARQRYHRLIQFYDSETLEGIPGAEVRDEVTGNTVRTSASGHIVLVPEFVKQSGAMLVARMVGYDPVGPFVVDPTSDTTLVVPMKRQLAGQALPAVITNAAHTASNVEERARAFGGKSIAPGTLRTAEYETKSLKDALRLNGITGDFPVRNATGASRVIRAGGSSGSDGCTVRIVLDGSTTAGTLVDLDDPAAAYDGVEFYRSAVMLPEELRKLAGSCGTLFLWSRAR